MQIMHGVALELQLAALSTTPKMTRGEMAFAAHRGYPSRTKARMSQGDDLHLVWMDQIRSHCLAGETKRSVDSDFV
jgi:hypothetical protein